MISRSKRQFNPILSLLYNVLCSAKQQFTELLRKVKLDGITTSSVHDPTQQFHHTFIFGDITPEIDDMNKSVMCELNSLIIIKTKILAIHLQLFMLLLIRNFSIKDT